MMLVLTHVQTWILCLETLSQYSSEFCFLILERLSINDACFGACPDLDTLFGNILSIYMNVRRKLLLVLQHGMYGESLSKKINYTVQNYRTNWRNHVRRMERVRIPKQLTTYAPGRRRCLGRPNKGWHETVTGHLA
jgi:hypothetical protein